MMSDEPLDRRNLLVDLAAGDHRCTARSKRTGERCQLPAMLGGNVCRAHGGAAPQTRAKAKRRLEQAADVLVQRLLQFALHGNAPDSVALQAIRDALDRAGLAAKTQVEVGVDPAPWETMMMDFARTSRERHEALARGERPPALATQRPDVLDAEVVPDPADDRPSGPVDGCAGAGQPATPPPHFATPSGPRSRELATAEDAVADAAKANRTARVNHTRRKRR